MIESPDFLPLGSVVRLQGNEHKLLIIARGVVARAEEGKRYFDYGACLYPEGLMGEAIVYCNHDKIEEVFHRGYEDEDDVAVLQQIREVLAVTDMQKGDPSPLGAW